MASAETTLPPGTRVGGRYVLERFVRRGGLADVYRARAEGGGLRRFEVRLVRGASLGADTPAEVLRELKRVEALGLASVPRVVAVEADPAGLLVVTEGLDAGGTWESLREVLTAGDRLVPPVLDKLLEAMVQVLDGLHRADPAMLHRALCPENISLVERRSAVRIEESGLAHALAASGAVSGRVLAAPKAYVSPDELLQRPGPRADLFAMASVVYEVLTLRPAFRAVSEAATETAILRGPRPSVLSARADLSYEVDDVLHRAWSTDVHGGFATAAELVAALRGALAAPAGPRPSTTPPARTSLAPAAGRSSTPPPPPPAALKSLTQTLKTGSESPLRAAANAASSAARTGLGSTQKVTVPRINAPGTERLDPAAAEVNPLRANTMLGVPPPRPTQPVVARAEAPPGTTTRAPGLRPAPPVAPPPPGDAAPAPAPDAWDEVDKPAEVPVVEPAASEGPASAPSAEEASTAAAPAEPSPTVSAPVVDAEPAAALASAPASEDLEADDDLVPASSDLPTMELGEADELPEGVPVPAADLQVVEMPPESEAPLVTVEVPVPVAPRAPSIPPPMPHPPRASAPEVAPPLAVAEAPPPVARAMPPVASVPVGLPPTTPVSPPPVGDPVVVRVARILGVAVVLAAVVVTAGQIYLSQRPTQPVVAQPVATPPVVAQPVATPPVATPPVATPPVAAQPAVDAGPSVVQAEADAAVAPSQDAAVAAAAPVVDAGQGPVEPAPSAPVAAADASAPMRGHPRVREEDQYLVRVEPAVLRCVAQSGHRRRCRATVTFEGATGAASEVRLTSVYSDPPTGPCIEQALRSATMPPFTDERWTTTFIFDPVERR